MTTDGHSRAYVAYQNGFSVLPICYDNKDAKISSRPFFIWGT